MLKSKFLDIASTFSKRELKEFRDFLNSPFHNTNKNVIRLYENIRKSTPGFDPALLDKEKLYRKIYPGKKYNDTVMRILLSDLLKLAEKFLIVCRSHEDFFGENLFLLEELKNRKLDSLYNSVYKETKQMLENNPDQRAKFFGRYQLEFLNIDFYLLRDKQQLITANVLERAENIIFFTLIEAVRNIHDLIINEKTYNAVFANNLVYEFMNNFDFEAYVEKIKTAKPEHYALMKTYSKLLYAIMNEGDDKKFDDFKNSVIEFLDSLNRDEVRHFLHDLESCCLNNSKYNYEKYKTEIFWVHRQMLETNTYCFPGTDVMTAQRYKNILSGGMNMSDIGWVKGFVKNYSGKVQPEYRESMLLYSNALIMFAEKDFTGSLENLNRIRNDYFTLKMDIKSWTLKIYYELDYFDSAFSLIDTYKHFISKNKSLSDHFRERHMNFIKYTGDLLKLKAGQGSTDKYELGRMISLQKNVVHKDWLRDKIGKI